MTLFVGLLFIKSVHTHEYADASQDHHAANISKITHPCPICEYDFAKDKDHYFQVFEEQVCPSASFNYFLQPAMLVTSIGFTAAGRGPPSVC